MFVNHQSNAKSWRVACVDMMKIVEKVVIAAEVGKLKFHFILVIHSIEICMQHFCEIYSQSL